MSDPFGRCMADGGWRREAEDERSQVHYVFLPQLTVSGQYQSAHKRAEVIEDKTAGKTLCRYEYSEGLWTG